MPPQVTEEVLRLLAVSQGEMKRADMQAVSGPKHEYHLREAYLRLALKAGAIKMTM